MLVRVCYWEYSWIAEQKNQNELPPPVGAVSELPELLPLPVRMAYGSIAQYQVIFFPLMLLDIWGLICKDVGNTDSVLRAAAILRESVSSDGVSAFVLCQALVPEASPCLREYDLIVLSFAVNKEQTREVFGVVEGLSLRNHGSEEMDKRLHLSCPTPYVCASFTLRMKPSNVPEDRSRTLIEIRRVTSLKTQVDQLSMVSELPHFPLYNVIMDPIKCSEAFTLIEEAPVARPIEVSCMGKLNENQQKVVTSVLETVLKTEKDVPKVAMLLRPPGTGKSDVIVQLVFRLLSQHYTEKKKMPRILICAPSNNATDEITQQLTNTDNYKQKGFSVVRVGDLSVINPNLHEIAFETFIKAEHEKLVAERKSRITAHIKMGEKELEKLEKMKHDLFSIRSDVTENRYHGNPRFLEMETREIQEKIKGQLEAKQRLEKALARPLLREIWSAKEAIIGQANVICTTLNSVRNTDMENVFLRSKGGNEDSEILCCIIDDASQCTEPESLTPLGLGISKLILIGDPVQLQATVCSQYAQRLKFDQSLFNRFWLAHIVVPLILPTTIRTNNN